MRTFSLILKEAVHRKLNFLLSLLAVAAAVALFVSFFTTGLASKRETARLMRDIGFNLRIIPKATDMNRFWTEGFSEQTMPQEYVYRFASQGGLSYNHLLAVLQRKVPLNDMEVILTGISQEVCPPGKKKPPMLFSIRQGAVYVGFEVARRLGLGSGDELDLLGKTFTVERCLSESGSDDDIRIYGSLRDVQSLLNMKGMVNEIQALECICRDSSRDALTVLRRELEQLIPDAKVIRIGNIATARERQRQMAEKYFTFILPFVVVVCAAWVGVLSMMNVRERRPEIGILRALGYGSGRIALLFLGKATVIGVLGAALGFAVGTVLALRFGTDIFMVTAKAIKPMYGLLGRSLIVAPVFTAISSFIPAMMAVAQDPALTLRQE